MRPPQAPATEARPGGGQTTVYPADLDIDVTADVCPMTYVRTRLALDRLQSGQLLGVRLQGEEPARSVPDTARLQGHEVVEMVAQANGVTRVVIRKK